MIPGVSFTSIGVGAGGLIAYGGSSHLTDGFALLCAVGAFVFICSVEALFSS